MALAFMIVSGCSGAPVAATSEQVVMFTVEVDNEDMYVSASLAVSVDWESALSVDKGVVAIVPYDLSEGVGTLSVYIPLEDLNLGYDGDYLDIPIPATPIGQVSISLSQAVTGIPATIASVDVVLEAAVSVCGITCTSGNEDVLTQTSALRWTEWGEKSIQVDLDDANDATVSTRFQYALSIGVIASVLGGLEGLTEFTLVPQTDIAAVEGTPSVSTQISVQQDLLSQYLLPIIVIVVVAAAAVAAIVLMRRRKKKG